MGEKNQSASQLLHTSVSDFSLNATHKRFFFFFFFGGGGWKFLEFNFLKFSFGTLFEYYGSIEAS